MSDKSKYSFLIAFTRQLAAALEDDDDDIAIQLSSLGVSLDLLRADYGDDPGIGDGGLHESVDDDDAPGDDTPLGVALARIAELEAAGARHGAPADVVLTRRSASGGLPAGVPQRARVGRKRRESPVLTKGGKRRAKK